MEDTIIYFPLESGDETAIAENQRQRGDPKSIQMEKKHHQQKRTIVLIFQSFKINNSKNNTNQ